MGMSADDFWKGDPALAKAYREAEKIKRDRLNERLWLQGMYIYEALCDASPLFRAFGKKGTKAVPYSKEPYALDDDEKKKRELKREKAVAEKGKAVATAWMNRVNAQMRAKKKAAEGEPPKT